MTQPTRIDSCTTISEPGRYVLDTDIQNASGGMCIVIEAEDVVFDGQGHELNGSGGPAGSGDMGVAVADANVTIRNLTTVGWGFGVLLSDVSNGSVEDVTARENALFGIGIVDGTGLALTAVEASGNGRSGIAAVDVSRLALADVETHGNGLSGVSVVGSTRLNLSDLAATANDRNGLSITNASLVTVIDAALTGNRFAGVLLSGSRDVHLAESTVRNNTRNGIIGLNDRNTTGENVTLDGTRISFTSGNVTLDGTVAPAAPPAGTANVDGYVAARSFGNASALRLTVHYDEANVSALDETTLALWRYDEGWLRVPGSTVDADRNAVTGSVSTEATETTGRSTVVAAFGNETGQRQVQPRNESEPNDERGQANEVEPGTVHSGALSTNDEDWFAVSVDRGEAISVDLSRLSDGGQFNLRLEDPDGTSLAFTTVGGDEQTTIGATAQQTGTYYVSVRYSDATGPYELAVTTETSDAFEPNENADTATSISPNESVKGTLTTGDEDWFAVDVERGEAITVDANRLSEGGQFNLRLMDPDGGTVEFATIRSRESITLGATAQQTGTYYVSMTSDDATGPYELAMTTETTDAFEPNENADTASPVENGVPVSGELTTGDEDWFSIQAERGELVAVNVTRLNDDGTFSVIARNPEGGSEAFETLTMRGSTRFELEATQSGNYFLQLRQSEGTGPYELTATTYSQEAEPNDQLANATSLRPNARAIGTIDSEDTDVFSVPLTRGEALTVDVARRGGEGDLTVSLASDGDTLDTATLRFDQRATLGLTANTTGTYNVIIESGDARGGIGEYTLALGTERTADREPNERPGDAAPLTLGEAIDGNITANDRDWYTVSASPGERITVTLDSVVANRTDLGAGAGAFVLELRGPDDDSLERVVVDDGEKVSFETQANTTGQYSIGVRGETGPGDLGESIGSYSLTVDVSLSDPNEPNDRRSTATNVSLGESVEAVLDPAESDWYAVDAAANDTLSVTLERATPEGVSAVVVYDDRDRPVAQEFVTTANATTIRTDVKADGTFYVQVLGVRGDTSPYTITVETAESAA